jgi:hypothetical protein
MLAIHLTTEGADCEGEDFDAHVRMGSPSEVAVDVFNSRVMDAARAHQESEAFPATPKGLVDAHAFLRGYGIAVRLQLP